jgi:hypothetical protein
MTVSNVQNPDVFQSGYFCTMYTQRALYEDRLSVLCHTFEVTNGFVLNFLLQSIRKVVRRIQSGFRHKIQFVHYMSWSNDDECEE